MQINCPQNASIKMGRFLQLCKCRLKPEEPLSFIGFYKFCSTILFKVFFFFFLPVFDYIIHISQYMKKVIHFLHLWLGTLCWGCNTRKKNVYSVFKPKKQKDCGSFTLSFLHAFLTLALYAIWYAYTVLIRQKVGHFAAFSYNLILGLIHI